MGRHNYVPDIRVIFTVLLLIGSLAAFFQFVPTSFFPFATVNNNVTSCPNNFKLSVSSTPPPSELPSDQIIERGVIKRSFLPVGTAAYNFVLMSAYRGGPNNFAVIGLSSKTLHDYGSPTYTCEYQNNNGSNVVVPGNKIPLQHFGYARIYVVIVVNCTFPQETDYLAGGRLLLHASTNGGYDRSVNAADTFIALTELPNSWHPSQFHSPPKYDYLYCGSSLFGNLSPQRIREWIAYHVRLFGTKSHFVFHDAGGIHPEVMEVLKPWMEAGFVTVHDIKDEERFDTFYHNQVVVLNDCLHRHRFATKWMFFFDVDEYIYLPEDVALDSIMELLKDYTMFNFEQVSMSHQLCLAQDAGQLHKKWGFEKLVYKNVKEMNRDQKYAIQPQHVYATGVHRSDNFDGNTTWLASQQMKYFHYHGTVAERGETCQQLLKDSSISVEGTPYVRDTTMRSMASLVKKFELETIGSKLQTTKL